MSQPWKAEDFEQWFVGRVSGALSVPAAEIDVDAPFLEHGLDSVATLQMTGELEQLTGTPLPATLLFEYPTIAALSRYLSSAP